MSEFDIISDNSQQNFKEVPENVLQMYNLRMLYLQGNFIETLQEDFFTKLPYLTWLDLRNNMLTSIPESIANHEYLENLLLSQNQITRLPDELGLVPKLRVLQIAENPIEYPDKTVIASGTKAICAYLKEEWEKNNQSTTSDEEEYEYDVEDEESESDKDKEENDEKQLIGDTLSGHPLKNTASSSLTVTGLSHKHEGDNDRIIHTISKDITKDVSKIRLKSCYNSSKYVKASTQTSSSTLAHNALRQDWMEKLKILLEEQQRILQQEKSLQILHSWRQQKKSEPVRYVSSDELSQPPYGTSPEYNSILTRQDLNKEVKKFIRGDKRPLKKDSVERLINDLVSQLKDMEANYKKRQSPRAEINEAGKQIKMIMDIHKKILQLQSSNQNTI